MKADYRVLVEKIEEIAPPEWAVPGDNSGMQIEPAHAQVSGVGFVLEVTPEVVDWAQENGLEFLIAHHPVIHDPIQSLRYADPAGALLLRLARSGIGVYTAHTNYDSAPGGTGDSLARALGFETAGEPGVYERIVALGRPWDARELAQYIDAKLDARTRLSIAGDGQIERLCIATGSGASALEWARAHGAQGFLTGELKYHMALKCVQMGMSALEAGHYETEMPAMIALCGYLQEYLNTLEYTIRLRVYEASTSPYHRA